jgi:L-arabinokinase
VRETAGNDLYGAKITGGGSGGTVAVLGRRGADEALYKLAARYHEQTGYEPAIISGSSPGASVFGHLKLTIGGSVS